MNQLTELSDDPIRTAEDHEVWKDYLQLLAQDVLLRDWKLQTYSEGLSLLSARPDRIPGLLEINSWLAPINWRVVYFSGFVPAHIYASFQARRIFPIARNIRKRRDFAHSAAPDFLHDLFGHLPMLFDKKYGDLIQAWAVKRASAEASPEDGVVSAAQNRVIAAMEDADRDEHLIRSLTESLQHAQLVAADVPSLAGRLERFYTWCIEFGVIGAHSPSRKITGAAVLSSIGEMTRATSGQVRFLPFDIGALDRPVNYAIYQDEMYCVSDFEEYGRVLDNV